MSSTEEQLTLFAGDSPARTYPAPDAKQASTASAPGSGVSSPELLARFDPGTRSWRTSQCSWLETEAGGLAEFSESWPRSGLMRNGTAYRLPPLVPLTKGIASGLLPTPAATEYGSSQNGINGKGGTHERPSAGTPSLGTMARKGLWPTPNVPNGGRTLHHVEWRGGTAYNPKNGQKVQVGLESAVKMCPTPRASDWKGGLRPDQTSRKECDLYLPDMVNRRAGETGQLNPTWVDWLMGFPEGWTDCEP